MNNEESTSRQDGAAVEVERARQALNLAMLNLTSSPQRLVTAGELAEALTAVHDDILAMLKAAQASRR